MLASLNNATLRTTLMGVKAPDGKNLFLSVDPNWNGSGYTVVYPTMYNTSAHEFVEYMPKYLQHAHGDAVLRWFTADAVVEANNMTWDEASQRPISQDGLSFKADLARLDFEWCIDVSASSGDKPTLMDMDNLTLPSFQTAGGAPSLAHNAGPVTVTPARVPLSHPHSYEDSDDLTNASTLDSRVSVLETGLQKILEKLELLAAPGAIHPTTGSGSTSTPSEAPNLGLASTSPGARV